MISKRLLKFLGTLSIATQIAITSMVYPSIARAEMPTDAILGDWDLGPNQAALRITPRDSQSIFVQFCKRELLVQNHVCNASVILYFNYSASHESFIHSESAGQHLNATLQLDTQNNTHLHYSFRNDSGSGELIGSRI